MHGLRSWAPNGVGGWWQRSCRSLQQLEEAGTIKIAHVAGAGVAPGILAKGTPEAAFEEHGCKFCGGGKHCVEHAMNQKMKEKVKNEVAAAAPHRSIWEDLIGDPSGGPSSPPRESAPRGPRGARMGG